MLTFEVILLVTMQFTKQNCPTRHNHQFLIATGRIKFHSTKNRLENHNVSVFGRQISGDTQFLVHESVYCKEAAVVVFGVRASTGVNTSNLPVVVTKTKYLSQFLANTQILVEVARLDCYIIIKSQQQHDCQCLSHMEYNNDDETRFRLEFISAMVFIQPVNY